MIRTRDLILFFSCLLFLLIGIGTTIYTSSAPSSDQVVLSMSSPSDEPVEAEVAEVPATDRDSYIARLKEKLANDTSRIEPSASVTTDADTLAEVASSTAAETTFVVQECLYPDDTLPYIAQWPLSGAELKNDNGQRVFYTQTKVSTGTTSSSTVQIIDQPLLSVSVQPLPVPTSSCVPSEVVGVTAQGILMFNSDVRSYQNLNQNTLIGYARDGYPIYGVYTGDVDECGGYQHPAGYRYSLTPDRDFIIGCFKATPQTFTF